jgi:hypothetical protein
MNTQIIARTINWKRAWTAVVKKSAKSEGRRGGSRYQHRCTAIQEIYTLMS